MAFGAALGGAAIASYIAAAAAAVGTAISTYAAIAEAQRQQAIARYNKKVAENAAMAQRQAAAVEAENLRDEQRLVMSQTRAGLGASGVIPSEGTPVIVQADQAEKAALNEARIRYRGEIGAQASEQEAVLQAYQGRRAMKQGYIGAGASLLEGIGRTADAFAYARRPRTRA